MQKKIKHTLLLACVALAGLWAGWHMQVERSTLAYNKGNLIRFHVIANSNTAEDQALKYQVRDIIIKSMAARFENVDDVDRARAIVKESLDDIKILAAGHIRDAGYNYPVRVSLGDYPFPAKSYNLGQSEGKTEYLTLPADTYEAVRVEIGEGNGANWWCILFPPLCFVDFTQSEVSPSMAHSLPVTSIPGDGEDLKQQGEVKKPAVEAFKLSGFDEVDPERESEVDKQTGKYGVELRFKCVEMYQNTVGWFSEMAGKKV